MNDKTKEIVSEAGLSAEFPAPRDDEPAPLRQDIVDELSDHLHCAMRRELFATSDHQIARQRVLSKFGDPSAVARTLWFQAMWSTIMSQRLIVGAMTTAMMMCFILVGVACWLLRQQQVTATQLQQINAQLVEQLARITESHSANRTPAAATIISPLEVRLSIGTPDGPPASEYEVTLSQLGFDKDKSISERADPNGHVDFGYCNPGRYQIRIKTPWGFYSDARRFSLHPSTAHIEQIVCPAEPAEAQVSLVARLPEDLQQRGVEALVQFDRGKLEVGNDVWREVLPFGKWCVSIEENEWDFFFAMREVFGTRPPDPRALPPASQAALQPKWWIREKI